MPQIIGHIFDLQHFSTDDGPGIRSTVFLKGCPLKCQWCANPESQSPQRQLAHRSAVCIGCGMCMASCPQGALSPGEKGMVIDRTKCVGCGSCVKMCPTGAMFFYGRDISVEEAFAEVRKDKSYYEHSGGGVTTGGGECMMQPEFVAELFKLCRAEGIHTALDTCGYFPEESLPLVWDYTDLVLFDLKLMNKAKHMEYIGTDNELIHRNLEAMINKGMTVFIRVPVIPGVNDSEEELEAIAKYVAELDKNLHVDILPYHRFGERKYEMLGMEYKLKGTVSPDDEKKASYGAIFEKYGIDHRIH